jgi:hypothetical protein
MYQKGKSGNPDGRPKGARNKRSILRDALDNVYSDGEAGFWLAVAERSEKGDANAVAMIGSRLIAPLKATDMPVQLEGLDGGSLTEKAEKIISLMGSGDISPSEATSMINAITGLCRVQEIEDLVKRLEVLERVLKER